jgi:hypothetical protein
VKRKKKDEEGPSPVTVFTGRIEDFVRSKIEACEKAKASCPDVYGRIALAGQVNALREVLKFIGRA